MRKYEFTGETKQIGFGDITLHRIRAVIEFGEVKIGDLGGWIESEKNLSHHGNSWVSENAEVYGNAVVCGGAEVWGNAVVCENALVFENAEVCGNVVVRGNALIYGNSFVCGESEVYENAIVSGKSVVCGGAVVCGKAMVDGNTVLNGKASVCANAAVSSASHVLVIGAIGSRNDFTTFFKDKDGDISVKCGCFTGKIDKFLERVISTHGNSKHGMTYQKAVELAKLQIDLTDGAVGNEK